MSGNILIQNNTGRLLNVYQLCLIHQLFFNPKKTLYQLCIDCMSTEYQKSIKKISNK